MVSFLIIITVFFLVYFLNNYIRKSIVKKNPNFTAEEVQNKLNGDSAMVFFIGIVVILMSLFYVNVVYMSPSEKLQKEKLELADRKKAEAEKVLKEEYDRLGLRSNEISILKQNVIPIGSLEDEVKNAYIILNSKKYFIDTEIIRFTGLLKKVKGTLFEKRVKKTKDSLIVNKEIIEENSRRENEAKKEKELAEKRKLFESEFRNSLLDRGLDIKVKVYGKDNKKIKLTYILFNDVWARKFDTEGYFDQLHSRGFNYVELTDGYDYKTAMKYKE